MAHSFKSKFKTWFPPVFINTLNSVNQVLFFSLGIKGFSSPNKVMWCMFLIFDMQEVMAHRQVVEGISSTLSPLVE